MTEPQLVTLTEDDGSTSLLDAARLDRDVADLVVMLTTVGSAGKRLWELKAETGSLAYCRLVASRTVTLFAQWFLLECPAFRYRASLDHLRKFVQAARTEQIVIPTPYPRRIPPKFATTGETSPENE